MMTLRLEERLCEPCCGLIVGVSAKDSMDREVLVPKGLIDTPSAFPTTVITAMVPSDVGVEAALIELRVGLGVVPG